MVSLLLVAAAFNAVVAIGVQYVVAACGHQLPFWPVFLGLLLSDSFDIALKG